MSLDVRALRVLHRTLRVYGHCRTYTDRGHFTVYSYDRHRAVQPREADFATVFRRPSQLRFDVRETDDTSPWHDEAVVCWNGGGVLTCRPLLDDQQESGSIEGALARATGLSPGAADYIPHLLLRRPWKYALERRAHLRGTRVLDGAECYKIAFESESGDRAYTLWIDAGSYLVRRILEVRAREAMAPTRARRTQTVFCLAPEVDVGVDEDLFHYGT